MSWTEAKKQIQAIEGLISEKEAKCLYELAKSCGGDIVEIGSWKGKSTVCLALGSKAGSKGKVFAIDPHEGIADSCTKLIGPRESTEPIFRENIKKAGVDGIVVPLVMKSEEAINKWTKHISLLWIDGDHEYEGVKKDILLFEPYLKIGSRICFHDAFYLLTNSCSGVRKAVDEEIFRSNRFADIHFCDRIVYATKVSGLSLSRKLFKLPKSLMWHMPPIIYSSRRFMAYFLRKIGLLKPVKSIFNIK